MTPSEPSCLRFELPATPDSVPAARHALSDLADRLGADSGAVRIVVSELVGNAVQHAYVGHDPGPVVVLAEIIHGRLVVTIADRGKGMTPRPDSPGLGMGLPVTSKLGREVTIESGAHGTTISVAFDIEASAEGSATELHAAVGRELARTRRTARPSGRRLFRGRPATDARGEPANRPRRAQRSRTPSRHRLGR